MYIILAVLALYLNVFVGVVQAFLRIPVLRTMAPTQSEPPFLLTQLTVLVVFVALSIAAVVRFRIEPGWFDFGRSDVSLTSLSGTTKTLIHGFHRFRGGECYVTHERTCAP